MNLSDFIAFFNFLPWEYEFLSPYYFLLLILIPFLIFLINTKNKSKGEMKFSSLETNLINLNSKKISKISKLVNYLYLLTFIFMVFAIAKPHYKKGFKDEKDYKYKYGIDIILALDISMSMLAKDFEPNRLEVAKELAKDFIDAREGDRIGLIAYEGEALTACPSTLDYQILKKQIDFLQPGMLGGSTAIGTGLGTAVTRLRDNSMPSKVIILLTDGVNYQGEITPIQAAQLAKNKKIKVYTIGIGSLGLAPSPVYTPFGIQYENLPVEIDEETLIEIAKITGGKYFRATDKKEFKKIYREIDKLEKRKIKNINSDNEIPINPNAFLFWALIFFISGISLNYFYLNKHGK